MIVNVIRGAQTLGKFCGRYGLPIRLKCIGDEDEDGSLFHRQDVTGKTTKAAAAATTQESSAPLKTSNINDALFSTVLLLLRHLDGVPKCRRKQTVRNIKSL